MARSIKKGPFADASLLKKIDAMNEKGEKSKREKSLLLRPGPAVPQSSRAWLDIQSPFMTEENTFRYM